MKTIHKLYIASIFFFIPFFAGAQSYALDTYRLDPAKKNWMQRIHTWPKSSTFKWHTPKGNSNMLNGQSGYTKYKRAFPELKSANQYIGAAMMFKSKRPRGTLKKFLKNKNLVQYHAPSNVFGAYDSKGYPIAFFRPVDGQKYYDNIGENPNYTFAGYIPYKSSSSSSRSKSSTGSRAKSSSSSSNNKGNSSNNTSNNTNTSTNNAPYQHTGEYSLRSYRPKPGVKTWLNNASKFSKDSTIKWYAKENISASKYAEEKYNKHKNAFPEIKSLTEYVAAAHQFKSRRPKGTLKKKLKNGDTVQYHEATNVFAAYNSAGMPRTMFRPIAGILYYEDLEKVSQIQYDGYGVKAPSKHLPKNKNLEVDNNAAVLQNTRDNNNSNLPKRGNNDNDESIPNASARAENPYDVFSDDLFLDPNAGRKISGIALELLNTNDPKKKAIGFKKSWDAIEHILVLSDVISDAKAKKMVAIKELVEPKDPKAKRLQSLPPGALIGFFAPLPNGQERMIHALVAIGNGRAIGTGNAAIDMGSSKGLEAIDLASINMSSNSTITKKQGSKTMEIIVRVNNPLELSDTGVYAAMPSNNQSDDDDNDDVYEIPDAREAQVNQGQQSHDDNDDEYELPDASLAQVNQGQNRHDDNDNVYEIPGARQAQANVSGIYGPVPPKSANGNNALGSAGRAGIPIYDLNRVATNHVDPSIWKPLFGLSSADLANRYYHQNKGSFPSINSVEDYVALAVQFYNKPPENSMRRTLSNGDQLFYNDEYEIFAAYTNIGNPIQFLHPQKKYIHFWEYAYEAVCSSGDQSDILDASSASNGLKGKVGNIYKTTPLHGEYNGENKGLCQFFRRYNVEYCSISERQALEVFVKDGLLVDTKGQPIDTKGASRALKEAEPHMAIFVMDENGRIYQFKYPFQARFHHSSFVSGAPVAAAGEMRVFNGELVKINARSGHYKPSVDYVQQVLDELKARGYNKKLPKIEPGF